MLRLIQSGTVRSEVINVPEGLRELLSDITREVLRCQPTAETLCQFVVDYLQSVIVARDKARIAKSVIDQALSVVDEVIGDICICDIPKAKAEYMGESMEECFRRFLAQRRCENGINKEVIKFNGIDMLDELMQKCKFTDDELKISKPLIEAAYQKFVDIYLTAKESSEGADALYQYFREREISKMEQRLREEAAVKIQSHFRGFMQRKLLFVDGTENLDDIQRIKAATKIQRFYRMKMGLSRRSNVNKEDEKRSRYACPPANKDADENQK